MKRTYLTPRSRGVFAGISLAMGLLTACGPGGGSGGPQLSASGSSCAAGVAQILVGDGFMKRLCGCAETADVIFYSGQTPTLTCTAAVGTQIYFQFVGTRTRHQILSTGSPSFPSTMVFKPTRKRFVVGTVSLPAAGSYSFHDAFNQALAGTLVGI